MSRGRSGDFKGVLQNDLAFLKDDTKAVEETLASKGSSKEFWRFLSQTLVKHRAKFAESLRLAAMGYHFRKLSELYGEV